MFQAPMAATPRVHRTPAPDAGLPEDIPTWPAAVRFTCSRQAIGQFFAELTLEQARDAIGAGDFYHRPVAAYGQQRLDIKLTHRVVIAAIGLARLAMARREYGSALP